MDSKMNERIKELIEKATVRGEEYLPGNDGHPTPTFYFDKEKFAELIVGECISTLEEKIYRSIDGDGDEIWVDLILKEHFGVEE
jgi:hypothetical protein